MKKLCILLFLAFSCIANAQIVNIPDANFKAALLSASPSNSIAKDLSDNFFKIDSNNDGEIQIAEALNVSYLSIVNSNINDLTGIDFFSNITILICSNNQLTDLNVSNLFNLEVLDCVNNQIIVLNTDGLINLQELYCESNLISNGNFSSLLSLVILDCDDNNLNNLNVSNLNYLESVYVNNNFIENINAQNLPSIQTFQTSGNISLKNVFLKKSNYFAFDILENSNILYICSSDEFVDFIQSEISSYNYIDCHVNTYCTFNPGGIFYEISGNTKFDYDNNGCGVSDINYPNLKLSITDGITSGSFISNNSSDYYIPVQAGNHTITPVLENPNYFTILPTNFTVDFPTQASPFAQDFCITANGVHSDVEVVLIPITPARPGFDAHYRIIYKNIGNQVENGLVTFAYQEDVLDFVSSSLSASSQNTLANTTTLSWNYSNLMPFETRTIDVVLNVNSPTETPAINIGDVLGIFSEITTTNTDEDLSNNSSGLRQVVVGSYDPNDKTCVEGEVVDISIVGEYVHYVIRFENTGTYPAENIVVKDMIDVSKFDVSTLVPLHGSHEFFTRINDNKVEFIFENINLDFNDATNDGYVAFKIKTLPTLTVGDTFSNDANIYFDYNFPITTNEYVTTIQNVLSNQDFDFENEFVLYPNPTRNILNISSKNQTEIQSVEIYNIVGQVVIAIPNSTKAIDVSSLVTGTYFIKVNTEKGSTTTKFVKE